MSISSISLASVTTTSEKPVQNHMNLFTRAVSEYEKTFCDETATRMNRYLQLISVSINTSIFDPNTSVVCQFYASVYKLLSIVEPRCTLSWACVNVLQAACSNQAARRELINTYEFIPLLSRLLSEKLSMPKQISLLTVIQDLSCGVKISWIIPNLENLMTTLIRFIYNKATSEQVLLLSFGIIINLCFKNVPCCYLLSKCVDVKEFLKFSTTFMNSKLAVCVCKLFIILDNAHGIINDKPFIQLLRTTLASILECFQTKETNLMRQNIDFFLEVTANNRNLCQLIERNMPDYATHIQGILCMITPSSPAPASESLVRDGECIRLVFTFLTSIVTLGLSQLQQFCAEMTTIALNWVHSESVAFDATKLLKAITAFQCSASHPSKFGQEMLSSLPLLIAHWQSIGADTVMTIEQCGRLTNTMQILQMLAKNGETCDRVGELLSPDLFDKVFGLAMIDNVGVTDANNLTPDAFEMYINAIALLNLLAKQFSELRIYLDGKLQHPQVHAILAEGLISANVAIRTSVLSIIAGEARSDAICAAIAAAVIPDARLASAQRTKDAPTTSSMDENCFLYCMMGAQNTSPVDVAIQTLNEARSGNHIDIAICDVMELYESKIASMGHSERVLAASSEAASSACTQLRQQQAKMSSEMSRIRQLLLRNENLLKKALVKGDAQDERIAGLQQECEGHVAKLQQQEAEIAERICEMEKKVQASDASLANSKTVIATLEESLWKLEKIKQRKEEQKEEEIKKLNYELQASNQRTCEIEELLAAKERALQQKSKQLEEAKCEMHTKCKELAACKKENDENRLIIATITKLTSGK